MRILIADDEALTRMGLRAILRDIGHVVVGAAADGQAALQLACRKEPDLAILDIKMPGMDGLAAAEAIAQQCPLPVVMLTAYSERDLVQRAAATETVQAYLVKPVREADLAPTLDLAVARGAAYYGMVALIDDSVKRMLDVLECRGLRENTVILFVTDHGELLGDHGLILKGPLHYESLLRVPFVWNGPNHLAGGRTVGGLSSLIDLFPSILDLAGVPVPEGTQGKTLIRPLTGASDRAHDQVYVENDADVLGLRLRTLVTERWKLTWYAGQDDAEIYDLQEDPHEFVNLWDRCDPAIQHELVSRLLETVVANQDTLPPKISHA